MSKNILVWIATLGLAFQLTACSSQDEKADDVEMSDVEALVDESGEVAANNEEPKMSETLPEDELSSQDTVAEPVPAPAEDEIAAPVPTPSEDTSISSELANELAEPNTTVTESQPPMSSEIAPPYESAPAPTPTETETASIEAPMETPAEEPEKKPAPAPLRKVATEPWMIGKSNVNAIYFARPEETIEEISMMIYGEDRTKEMKKINPSLKSRQPRPGEKIYYASPRRPDDRSRIVNYYEEMGVQPEVYVAQSGDNIRTVAKNLLGYDGAWKEVWSTNEVESKGALDAGTELRYWGPASIAHLKTEGTQVAAAGTSENQEQMQNNMTPPPQEETMAPPVAETMPMEQLPPPPPLEPPSQQAMNDLPPPAEAGMEALPPPPPEPSQAINDIPPPPPPIEAAPAPTKKKRPTEMAAEGMDEDTTMALGAVAVIAAAAAAMLVMRRKRRRREAEAQFDSTHVGT